MTDTTRPHGGGQAAENKARMSGADAQPLPEPLAKATKGFAAGAPEDDAPHLQDGGATTAG